ncbi:MAG TPA: Gfo/Idh/MocA family oxidoreductase [Bacillales bacterium]|nr:Gfo/Idh/MocA family oxidoreductase [Bacillales bacterium]
MVRIALLGTGFQGQGHLNTIKEIPEIELVGMCDLNREALTRAEKKFGIPAFSDYVEMLKETKPEGVIICTPPEVRLQPVREAAERGIHCFIEKPPAKHLHMAEEVIEVLDRTGVINSVGFMFRYSQAANRCRELIQGRRIALVRSAMLDGLALRENWPRWFFDKERSGGPIFDQAVHMLDLSRFMLGEMSQISGFQDNLVIPKEGDFTVEDSFSLSLRYKDGPLQNHTHSWVYPGFVAEMEFISDEMHLTLDLARGRLSGHIDGEPIDFENEDHLYRKELEVFAEAISSNRQDLIHSNYSDSVKSLSAALGAVKALEEEKVVSLEQLENIRMSNK